MFTSKRLLRAADNLVNRHFAVGKGESVLITGDTATESRLIQAVADTVGRPLRGMRVLNVGCGTGGFNVAVERAGWPACQQSLDRCHLASSAFGDVSDGPRDAFSVSQPPTGG